MPRLPLRIFPLGLSLGLMFTAGVQMDRAAARSATRRRRRPSLLTSSKASRGEASDLCAAGARSPSQA